MFDPRVYESPFILKIRNKFLYWLRNLIFLPAFLLSFHFFIGLLPILNGIKLTLEIILLVAAFSILSFDDDWHINFRSQINLFIASLLIVVFSIIFYSREGIFFYLIYFNLTLGFGIIKLRNNLQFKIKLIGSGIFIITVILSGFLYFFSRMSQGNSWIANILILIPFTIFLSLILFISPPIQYQAHLRRLFRLISQDRILNRISITRNFTNIFNRITSLSIQFIKPKQIDTLLIIWFMIGALAPPVLQFSLWVSPYLTQPKEPISLITLMAIGIISGFIFLMLRLLVWLYQNRPKHVVIPFVPRDKPNTELQIIADLATHTFVEQLRYVARLLNLRLAENIQDLADNQQALFVTSGYEQEFIAQIQTLANIEVIGNVRVPFGNLFSTILVLADTKVYGVVHRKQDKQYEVWIELTRRDGHRVAVDRMEISGDTISDIDVIELQKTAKQSAVKLMMQLGQGSYTTSSWQGLITFLNGVHASSQGNWWQAIAYYNRAIALEEIAQQEFGIGHYHLGAALIFQGDMVSGLRHLHIADSTSPPLAETQYMLALALLYKHWDKLNEDTVIFEYIVKHCRYALKLRSEFPEAFHLLGSVYYQRGKLGERDVTKRWDNSTPIGKDNRQTKKYQDDYRLAASHLRQAIKQYIKVLSRLSDNSDSSDILQKTYQRTLRTYAMATHQLADAYRSPSVPK